MALIAKFGKRTDVPGLPDLAAAPGTVPHKTHDFTVTMPTPIMITGPGSRCLGRRLKTRPVTPGAKTPFRQNALMATRANVTKTTSGIVPVAGTGAPGANRHGFVNGFVAFDTA